MDGPDRDRKAKDRRQELEEALDRALAANGLHPGYKETIRRLVFDPSDEWRHCCDSDCDPCVLPMARAVDMVRATLKR